MVHLSRVTCPSLLLLYLVPVILCQIQSALDDPAASSFRPTVPAVTAVGSTPAPRLAGLCRDGWTAGSILDFSGVEIPVCFRVNREPLTWSEARASCRKDYGFLLKLDSPAKIGNRHLVSHLAENGLTRSWTGLHTYAEHLVWDDLIPNTVRPQNSQNDTLGPIRPWKLSDSDLPDTSEFCGLLDIDDDDRKRRRKRAPDEDTSDGLDLSSLRDRIFQFQRAAAGKFPPTAAFQSMLTRAQYSDQLPELPGIQSDHQIPGSGLTDSNLQSGGLHTDIQGFEMSSDDKESPSSDSSGTTNFMQSEFFVTDSPLSQSELFGSVKDMSEKLKDSQVNNIDTTQDGSKTLIDNVRDKIIKHSDDQPSAFEPPSLEQLHGLESLVGSKSSDDLGSDHQIESPTLVVPNPSEVPMIAPNIGENITRVTDTLIHEKPVISNVINTVDILPENADVGLNFDDIAENVDNIDKTNTDDNKLTIMGSPSVVSDINVGTSLTDLMKNTETDETKKDDAVSESKSLLDDIIQTSSELKNVLPSESNIEDRGSDVDTKHSEIFPEAVDAIVEKLEETSSNLGKVDPTETTNALLENISETDEPKHNDITLPKIDSELSRGSFDDKDDHTEKLRETVFDLIDESNKDVSEIIGVANNISTNDNDNDVSLTDDIKTKEEDVKDAIEKLTEDNEVSTHLTETNQMVPSVISEDLNDIRETIATESHDDLKNEISEDSTKHFMADSIYNDHFAGLDDIDDLKQEEFNAENVTSERIEELMKADLDDLHESTSPMSNHDNIESKLENILEKGHNNEDKEDDRKDDVEKFKPDDNDTTPITTGGYSDRIEKENTDFHDKDLGEDDKKSPFVDIEEFMENLKSENDNVSDHKTHDEEFGDDTGEIKHGFNDSDKDDAIDRYQPNLDFDSDETEVNDETNGTGVNVHENTEVDDDVKEKEDRPDLAEDVQVGSTKTPVPQPPEQSMELSSCSARLPSVCFSYEVEVMSQASTCDEGWYGHVLLDSCYRVLDGRWTYEQAVSSCKALQARVALGQSDFERKFVLLSVSKDGRQLEGERFWMEATLDARGCQFFDARGTAGLMAGCGEALNVVCVKDAKSLINDWDIQIRGQSLERDLRQKRQILIATGDKVSYANSLDVDETPSNSASHPDPSYLLSSQQFQQLCVKLTTFKACK